MPLKTSIEFARKPSLTEAEKDLISSIWITITRKNDQSLMLTLPIIVWIVMEHIERTSNRNKKQLAIDFISTVINLIYDDSDVVGVHIDAMVSTTIELIIAASKGMIEVNNKHCQRLSSCC